MGNQYNKEPTSQERGSRLHSQHFYKTTSYFVGSEKKIDERCKCLLVCLQSVGRKEQIVVKDILFGIKMNDPEKFYGILKNI